MIIVLIGPPGSGKTTQAKLLSKKLSLATISTGDLVREAINTERYHIFKELVDKGGLLPDNVVFEIVRDKIKRVDLNKGFIIEGFPRTIKQACLMEEYLSERGKSIDFVFYMQISKELLKERILNRKNIEKIIRMDDDLDTFNKRIDVYFSSSFPVFTFYKNRNLLYEINASKTVDDINSELLNVIKSKELEEKAFK